jgi:hypothetical protein
VDKAATLIPPWSGGALQVPMLCSASLKAFVKARGGCLRELDLSYHELTDDLTPLVRPCVWSLLSRVDDHCNSPKDSSVRAGRV